MEERDRLFSLASDSFKSATEFKKNFSEAYFQFGQMLFDRTKKARADDQIEEVTEKIRGGKKTRGKRSETRGKGREKIERRKRRKKRPEKVIEGRVRRTHFSSLLSVTESEWGELPFGNQRRLDTLSASTLDNGGKEEREKKRKEGENGRREEREREREETDGGKERKLTMCYVITDPFSGKAQSRRSGHSSSAQSKERLLRYYRPFFRGVPKGLL